MTCINLIPHGLRQAAAMRARLLRWSITISAAAAVGLVPCMIEWSRKAQAATLQAEIDQLDSEVSSLRTKLSAATARTQQTLSELEKSKALRGKRSWSGMIALIAASMPEHCWLQSIATDPDTPPAGMSRTAIPANTPAATPTATVNPETVTIEAPRRLRLVGISTNDAQPLVFVEKLTESGVFSKVALQRVLRSPGRAGGDAQSYQFEIVCEW